MESLPTSLFRREIGFNFRPVPEYNFNNLLTKLQCQPEDRVSLPKGPDGPMSRYFSTNEGCPIFDIQFSPHSPNILGTIDEAGYLSLFDTSQSENIKERFLSRYHCQSNANMAFNWSGFHVGLVAVGSADHTVKLIDINTNGTFSLRHTFSAHNKTVKTVKFNPYNPDLIVSGGRDGSIMIWDIRCNHSSNGKSGRKPDNYINMAHPDPTDERKKSSESTKSVTDLAFQDEHTLISCGATDGIIKFWDMRKTYKSFRKMSATQNLAFPKKSTSTKGFSSLALDSRNNLYAATVCQEIFRFNLSNFSDVPDSQFEFDARKSFYVKINLSADGKYLISGSEEDTAAIWDTTKDSVKPFMLLETHFSNISCGIFSPTDPLKIVTAGDNSIISIWRYDKMANIDADDLNYDIKKKKISSYFTYNDECSNTNEDIDNKSQESQRSRSNRCVTTINNPINVIFSYRKSTTKKSMTATARTISLSQPIITSPTKKLILNRMLKDLPDYNIDGKLPHIPEVTTKKYKMKRSLTWLGEISSAKDSAISNSPPPHSASDKDKDKDKDQDIDKLNKKIKLSLSVQNSVKTSPKTPKTTPTSRKLKTTPISSTGRNSNSTSSKRKRKLINDSPNSAAGVQSNQTLLHYFTPISPSPNPVVPK